MGHNVDRRPTYPKEKKGRNNKSTITLLKKGLWWLCFAYCVLAVIFSIYKISYNEIQQSHIKKNPVATEAVIQRIGEKPAHRGNFPVYCEYRVSNSLYHAMFYQTQKEIAANSLYPGKIISITYEKDNPSNSMFGGTLLGKRNWHKKITSYRLPSFAPQGRGAYNAPRVVIADIPRSTQ